MTKLTKLSNWNQCRCYTLIESIHPNLVTLYIIGGQDRPLLGGSDINSVGVIDNIPWDNIRESIRHVIIEGKIVFNENYSSLKYLFYDCINLESIEGLNNFDTTNIVDMSWMFTNCSSLSKLVLDNFDTTNVADMFSMFSGCSGLIELDISNFAFNVGVNMWFMLSDCSQLVCIKLPDEFDVELFHIMIVDSNDSIDEFDEKKYEDMLSLDY